MSECGEPVNADRFGPARPMVFDRKLGRYREIEIAGPMKVDRKAVAERRAHRRAVKQAKAKQRRMKGK